jgi:hypothetical protein
MRKKQKMSKEKEDRGRKEEKQVVQCKNIRRRKNKCQNNLEGYGT